MNAADYCDFFSFSGFTFLYSCFKADDRLCFQFLYVLDYLYFFSQMKMTLQLVLHQQVRTVIVHCVCMYVCIFLLNINEERVHTIGLNSKHTN